MSKTKDNKNRRNKKKQFHEDSNFEERNYEIKAIENKVVDDSLKLDFKITVPFELTQKQIAFNKLLMHKNTNIVFCNGPAGTSKTFGAVYAALQLIKAKLKDNILYIRSAVESSSARMGFLPGEAEDKFAAYTYPLYEKLEELIPPQAVKTLVTNKVITTESTCFIRGRTFKDTVVIIDEPQNLTRKELLLLLTRFGKNTKMVLVGDFTQSDIKGNDYRRVFEEFRYNKGSRENGIEFFEFTKDDILRSPIIKHIAEVFEDLDAKENAWKRTKEKAHDYDNRERLLLETKDRTIEEWSVSPLPDPIVPVELLR